AGRGIGPVLELARGFLDLVAGFLAHVGLAVEHARDGLDRHPRRRGDVLDSGAHGWILPAGRMPPGRRDSSNAACATAGALVAQWPGTARVVKPVDTRDLNNLSLRGETPGVNPVKVGERPGCCGIRANAEPSPAHGPGRCREQTAGTFGCKAMVKA